jgi:YesN/AraC family two-component response regulator
MMATTTVPAKSRTSKIVLVVDDNPIVRRTVCQVFLSDGFVVCGEAANGRQAIDFVKQLTPDLIILDLAMPVMNGLQAAPELRKIAPKTVIILFTLYEVDFDKADKASKVGIDLMLSKTEPLSSVLDKACVLMGN